MTIEEIKDLIGEFSWGWNYLFFIETNKGNFEWHDAGYPGGDDTIRLVAMTCKQWCKNRNIPYVRDKGRHKIGDYCGTNLRLVS